MRPDLTFKAPVPSGGQFTPDEFAPHVLEGTAPVFFRPTIEYEWENEMQEFFPVSLTTEDGRIIDLRPSAPQTTEVQAILRGWKLDLWSEFLVTLHDTWVIS